MTEKIKVTVWTTPGNFIAGQCVNLLKFANTVLSETEFDIEEKVVNRKLSIDTFHEVFPGVNSFPQFVVGDVKMNLDEFYTYIKAKAPSNK